MLWFIVYVGGLMWVINVSHSLQTASKLHWSQCSVKINEEVVDQESRV